jgi:16S rRNA (cytosine1402-N4)-methyltransferase
MDEHGHIPVLPKEILDLLGPRKGEVAVDCTTGPGGHSVLLAAAIGPTGRLIGFDLDGEILAHARQRIEALGVPFDGFHDSFLTAPQRVRELGVRADIVLADLGFSSNQIDDPDRGFSFSADGPLDMRFDREQSTTAADLLARLSERDLANLIYEYGEEPWSRKIARKLVQTRRSKPIQTTAELAGLVVEAYGGRARHSRLHPATRTFMALRVAVNDELGALRALLEEIADGAEKIDEGGWLKGGSRIAIVSFNSLEDRLVKRAFAELARLGLAERLTKKPLIAGPDETAANPRSRSAKLRVVRIDGRSPK